MQRCDTSIRNVSLLDVSGTDSVVTDVAVPGDGILAVGQSLAYDASVVIEASGLTLSPGFIDVHTHDNTSVVSYTTEGATEDRGGRFLARGKTEWIQ